MEGVRSHGLAIEGWEFCQQRGRDDLFAARRALLLVVNRRGLRGTVLVLREREQADMVADHFAIHREGRPAPR